MGIGSALGLGVGSAVGSAAQALAQQQHSQQQAAGLLGIYQKSENVFVVQDTGQVIRGDENIEQYFKAKFFKQDLEKIINE